MIARNSGCTVSSKSLKLGSLLLFGGFIIHVVGFSIAKWASLNMSHSSTILSVQTSYHVGLWELCVCVKIILEQCACIKRDGDQAWFKAVQAMETLGLIGLAFTGIICLILVCWRQTKALKKLNIFSILCSSVFIIIGLIIFGVEKANDFNALVEIIGTKDTIEADGKLGTSFFLCAGAAGISFLACLPLFLIDLKTQIPESSNMQQQGHVNYVSPHQVHVIPNVSGQQPQRNSVPAYGPYSVPPPYTPQASWGYNTTSPPPQPDGKHYKG
ncbi:uncharacterized protein LOC132754399 isoform X1 [Ruditapes philippinarum]|uniref:uncharacterized protein LOC132754399 isoform X1 n=1 Tax=Ruditapes philippinarum TaxID=129788 RepID=UPI00295B2507|nr:uncharacterized protein LOC132754399 isoform X1 [Ruditapes philippinarum]